MFNPFKKNNEESQYSLHSGEKIFEEIKARLNEAQNSIKIAAAWFTDNELFQILRTKQSENKACKIEVILDDNKENYWLPFIELVKGGAIVKLSKGSGANGRMHEKFCIIDGRLLISGSYNWSKNARTDNYESVIVSEFQNTILDFETRFKELMESGTSYESEQIQDTAVTEEEALKAIEHQATFTSQFERVLDEMIYSSVVEYDRNSLVAKGYDRSEKCSGDSNIIYNELNTVYTEMLNSISASEQKKEILKAKINTHLHENTSNLNEKLGRSKELLKVEEENHTKALRKQIDFIKGNNSDLKEEINKIENSEIRNNENIIKSLNEERGIIENETLKMPFRWYIDIPTYLGLLGVFLYITLFYSSAAYILMFSERNAKSAKLLNQPVEEIGIYYSKALQKALEAGWSELLLIVFVPFFLICGIIYLKKLNSHRLFPKWLIKLFCLLLIDGFTAVAVTKSIHETNYLAGVESEHFKLSNIFMDMNFYLVFIFGMLSLLIFDLVMTYILKSLENRSDVHLNAKKKLRIKEIIEEINQLIKDNLNKSAIVANKRVLIEKNQSAIESIENEISTLPSLTSRKINLLENETNSQIINLDNIVKIAYNKIENELFSFSNHFIKDRINIFLQGWNNFIYSYYSKSISESKVNEAKLISNLWFQEQFGKKHLIQTINNEIPV